MNIIFLDIDGVLNTATDYIISAHKSHSDLLDKGKVSLLSKVIESLLYENINVRIVVSSTWRLHYSLDKLHKIFANKGWKQDRDMLYDTTPCMDSYTDRGTEIINWLVYNRDISNYIILDDHQENITNVISSSNISSTESINGFNINNANDIFEKFGCKRRFTVLI